MNKNSESNCKGEYTEKNRKEYRQRVMDLYIRPANVRTCESKSTDGDCLSNEALSQVEKSIPYPSSLPEVAIKAGATGYLCSLAQQWPRPACVSKERKGKHFLLTAKPSDAALITVLKGHSAESVLLRVESADPKDPAIAMGIGGKKETSGKKDIHYTNAKDPSIEKEGIEVNWKVVPRGNGGRGVYLLDVTPEHGNNCLYYKKDGYLLSYPNSCKGAGDAYRWILYDKASFER